MSTVFGYCIGSRIPVGVGSASSSRVYQWTPIAVVIHTIECDGRPVAPRGSGVAMNTFDLTTVSVMEGSSVTYLLDPDLLVSIETFKALPDDYFAVMYQLPRGFKKAEIVFAIRYPDGSQSERKKVQVFSEN